MTKRHPPESPFAGEGGKTLNGTITAADLFSWRREMGWTQVQAAAALGVSEPHYRKLENGHYPIHRRYRILICGADGKAKARRRK